MPSPCISVCQIDPVTGNCAGCYRTRDEIASWQRLSPEDQLALINVLQERKAERTGRRRRPTRPTRRKAS
ncbi:MAG: DUF1289 domain-containing protein [Gammaproteobacteria bacterium TMED183]|nr:DUF1289 domain-containing protein [SAR116 cluster bacterium]OUW37203.1 MAG: DUF1289 domain-containing protein [Gammaproteobacteria bacterium TMED183]HCV61996.1 DUF1289 domain-containing protein [Alphaproteobacteria bacterium]